VKFPFKKIRTKFCFCEFCCSSEFSGQIFSLLEKKGNFFSYVKFVSFFFLSLKIPNFCYHKIGKKKEKKKNKNLVESCQVGNVENNIAHQARHKRGFILKPYFGPIVHMLILSVMYFCHSLWFDLFYKFEQQEISVTLVQTSTPIFLISLSSNRVMSNVTLSSPSLWACFHPPIPSFNGVRKVR